MNLRFGFCKKSYPERGLTRNHIREINVRAKVS